MAEIAEPSAGMRRKHYELLATTLRESRAPGKSRRQIAREISEALLAANPNFNREKFLAACGA